MSWLKKHAEPHRQWRQTLLPIAAFVLNAALLWHFHDRYWYPPDDGNYAHVAERITQGEILNRDVQDIHAGYINFVNAASLRLFGPDVSLRYPLILATLAQAILLFRLLAARDALLAFVASVIGTTLGVIQFFNPTAHWYCGALTVVLAFWIVRGSVKRRERLMVAGALVGLVALFRQLSGVWLGMGLLTIALSESADGATGWRALLSKVLFAAMLVLLVLYTAFTREWLGVLLIASPAVAILVWAMETCGPAIKRPWRSWHTSEPAHPFPDYHYSSSTSRMDRLARGLGTWSEPPWDLAVSSSLVSRGTLPSPPRACLKLFPHSTQSGSSTVCIG